MARMKTVVSVVPLADNEKEFYCPGIRDGNVQLPNGRLVQFTNERFLASTTEDVEQLTLLTKRPGSLVFELE